MEQDRRQPQADRDEQEEAVSGSTDITRYVDKAMFSAEEMPEQAQSHPVVHLVSATPDPLGAIAAACRMYEGKGTPTLADITDDERRHYWGEVQKTHLLAPLEFVDLHFFIEGVTRAFTHQMVRQRTAVYAQESMRFAVKDEIAARPGPIIQASLPAGEGTVKLDSPAMVWALAVDKVWEAYNTLIKMGVPAEEARGLLPHDTLTRLNYKTNLRNLIDHAGNRLCTQAQFEWRLVFAGIVQAMRNGLEDPVGSGCVECGGTGANDWQWEIIANSNVFRPVCFAKGHCPFKADFDRGCTIRERVDAGQFGAIDDKEWMMDPTAGWVR